MTADEGAPRDHSAGASLTAVVTVTATGEVGYPPNPSWQRQWQDLLAARAVVAAYFAGEGPDNQEAGRAVEAGCAASSSLAENLPDRQAGMDYRAANPALKDALDLFDTTKHGVRHEGKTSGHVATAERCEFKVDPQGPVRPRETLELLTACCDAWAVHLRRIGLAVEWPEA